MIYNFDFYITDKSFDYKDGYGCTCNDIEYHGFSIDIIDEFVDITTLKPYGECSYVMENIKDLKSLKTFILDNFCYIDAELSENISNVERFSGLIKFIDRSIKKEVA